jgi:rod shape-determining protein MreC
MLPIWRNRPLMVTIITVIVLLVLLVMTAGVKDMSGTESVIGSILSPVQSALYSATDAISDFFSRMFSGADVQTENQDLKAQVAELEGQLQDYNEVKKENERLASLLKFVDTNPGLDIISAKVIRKDQGHWFSTFTINVGLANGVEADMPVVNGDGVVGMVIAAGANWSRVLSIIDSESGISAIVERTRDPGIVHGTVSSGDEEKATLTLGALPLNADLVPGDTVITSGLTDVFPKGIKIGEVIEVSSSSDGRTNEAVVKPWVDFNHLEEVSVITTKPVDAEEGAK